MQFGCALELFEEGLDGGVAFVAAAKDGQDFAFDAESKGNGHQAGRHLVNAESRDDGNRTPGGHHRGDDFRTLALGIHAGV